MIAELQAIGSRRLGPDMAALTPLLAGAERSVSGLRDAIGQLRRTHLEGHSAAETDAAGMEMLSYVADWLTGM